MPSYRIIEENLRAAMRCYASATAAGEVREYPGVVLASSGINYAVFNSAMLTEPVDAAGLDRAIAHAQVFFRARGLGWSLWLCEELLTSDIRTASASLRSRGMRLIANAPGMWTDHVAPPIRPAALFDWQEVRDEHTRADFAEVASVVFTLPYRISRQVYASESIWNSGMTGYVAYKEKQPVSIVVSVLLKRVAGIYSVGTLPDYQRLGYASTLIYHALEEARRKSGVEATVLQSTKQGLPLYTRMGYRIASNFAVYVQEPCGRPL